MEPNEHEEVELEEPAPTAWPLTMAFGATLFGTGLVTTGAVSLLGVVLFVAGAVGWFRAALPVERTVLVKAERAPLPEARSPLSHPRVAEARHRARVPIEVYPVTAGIRGGAAGAVVMALIAVAYGIVSRHTIWYPINLLVAGVDARASEATTAELNAFHAGALVFGTFLHALTSLLVGTLYGMLLPMFTRWPILAGGVVAPLVWSALLYPTIGIINPVLAQRINWGWFTFSQVGFGLAAGLVVSRSLRIRTRQSEPFASRIGLEEGPKP